MDDADTQLEISLKSVYDHVRRTDADTLAEGPFTHNPLQARGHLFPGGHDFVYQCAS